MKPNTPIGYAIAPTNNCLMDNGEE